MRYLVNRKEEPLPLFPPNTAIYRPFSEATEIFEEDGYHGYPGSSPMRSVASVSSTHPCLEISMDAVDINTNPAFLVWNWEHIHSLNPRQCRNPRLDRTDRF